MRAGRACCAPASAPRKSPRSRATGIPVSKMMQGEREKLLHMEEYLHKRVVGQDEAVRLVSDAIRRSRAGLADPSRPYGSFLWARPS